MLERLFALTEATGDVAMGSAELDSAELMHGVPGEDVINAAFVFSGQGGRFHDATRGAWYCARLRRTSELEVAYHYGRRLEQITRFDGLAKRVAEDETVYRDWLSDIHAELHVLEPASRFRAELAAEPLPQCYVAGQELARQLRRQRSSGILYPSVRHAGGTCIACFIPGLVANVRPGKQIRIKMQWRNGRYAAKIISR